MVYMIIKLKNTTLSPYELTNLIIKNKDNSLLKGKLNKDSLNKIQLVNEVMAFYFK